MQTLLNLFLIANSFVHAETEYSSAVLEDKPVAYWRFEGDLKSEVGNFAATNRNASLDIAGPRPKRHPAFPKENEAASFGGSGTFIKVKDPGDKSDFDFTNGDSITIEAWVNPDDIPEDQQVYILGKGRTNNKGFKASNQNWALRLRGVSGRCVLSFLFRSAATKEVKDAWHRWNSNSGFVPMTGWHHIAISYTFGKPESIRGYIDGKAQPGKWDYAGPTTAAPVVDNDEVWIGSSLGGGGSSTFRGLIDEVALYRHLLSEKELKSRFNIDESVSLPMDSNVAIEDIPEGKVLVQIMERVPNLSWKFIRPAPSEEFTQDVMALSQLPQKYSEQAIRIDRPAPFLVRLSARMTLAPGEHKLLLRSLNGARLYIDGKTAITNPFIRAGGGAHGRVPKLPSALREGMRVMPAGHSENVASFRSEGKEHLFVVELFVGSTKLRPELGEFSLSSVGPDQMDAFRVVSPVPGRNFTMTDEEWARFSDLSRRRVSEHNQQQRAAKGLEQKYWEERHAAARKIASQMSAPAVPDNTPGYPANNSIDLFINRQLATKGVQPAPLTSDLTFLRRLYLDVLGIVPSESQIQHFLSLPMSTRRTQIINECLEKDRWADNWMGYWQDVLAENPGMLKPMLNNTGPFRWWLHESFLDNKPFDRFVTELIEMKGSKYYGGPAGFAMASQNDLPMAAKAHVIGQAFLAVEMKCARCHDAPFHDFTQKDLFSTAAMLQRASVKVPKTSTIPLSEEELKKMIVDVTLKPGQAVQPEWVFDEFVKTDVSVESFARDPKDARSLLAARITTPHNTRFAEVIVNRLWKRYLGWGIVEPEDDWERMKPSHPELLSHLAREFVMNGYNLKHIARLILNSHTYQRAITHDKSQPLNKKQHLFASPHRKRMRAEQVLDSLFVITGKRFNSEPLNMDIDHRSGPGTFLNLGVPDRAWQFTSLSNERDRPSLAMPYAQSMNDLLKTFGWRESRQDPISARDDTPTVQQPAMLANGIVSRRFISLSDDSRFTTLALEAATPAEWVKKCFLAILAREPSSDELKVFASLLSKGFNDRVVENGQKMTAVRRVHAVSWSNHLSEEANAIKLEIERAVREGDPPTARLKPEWRERAEDVLWAIVNSPEFVFVP